MRTFKIGAWVEWESQAQGYRKRKIGKIIEIVHAWNFPVNGPNTASKRSHESYIVRVKRTLFWPRVKHLKRVHKPEVGQTKLKG